MRDAFLRQVLTVRSARNFQEGVNRGKVEVAFYKIRDLSRKPPGGSMTQPVRGTLDNILKQDSDHSPTRVYNEIVSLRRKG
jgi:hypothetical protein